MASLKDLHLVLFFTQGISLETWDRVGILEREIALYRALRPHLRRITFVTYGKGKEGRYSKILNGIHLIYNRFGLPENWYLRTIPIFHPFLWRGCTILKSNQVEGAQAGLRMARTFGKKFIARCGYLLSDFVCRRYGQNSEEFKRATSMEQEIFTKADRVVVTAHWMRDMVINRYGLNQEKVEVIPNYVDVELFKPPGDRSRNSKRICFVGRISIEKNLLSLIKAIQGMDGELIVVGDGPLAKDLKEFVKSKRLQVRFLGNLPNRRLPEVMNDSQLFVLPSLHEGHPKALLEAMACGLPVIGTNVRGIREIIHHRENGLLCGTSPGEIHEAIANIMEDRELQERIGRNAREFVVKNFCLERILEMELHLLERLIG